MRHRFLSDNELKYATEDWLTEPSGLFYFTDMKHCVLTKTVIMLKKTVFSSIFLLFDGNLYSPKNIGSKHKNKKNNKLNSINN